MSIGLFFGGAAFKTTFGNEFGNIELDANLEETHEWTAQPTENPVEDGAPVADHVIEQSDKLRIRGFVSDAPLNISPELQGTIGAADAGSRTQPVFELLNKLIKKREVMTVYTKHAIYTNMVLSSVTIPRAPANGESIEFTAEFVNIRKVRTQTVDVPKGISAKREAKAGGKKGATAKKADPLKDAGKKAAENVPKPPTSVGSVVLKSAVSGVKSLFGG